MRLSTGTLYEALSRLLDQGWVERAADPGADTGGRLRKAYALTRAGRQALEAETARMQALVARARRRLAQEDV